MKRKSKKTKKSFKAKKKNTFNWCFNLCRKAYKKYIEDPQEKFQSFDVTGLWRHTNGIAKNIIDIMNYVEDAIEKRLQIKIKIIKESNDVLRAHIQI